MLGRGPFLLTQFAVAFTVNINEDDRVPLLMNFVHRFIEETPEAQASERG